MFNRNEHRQHSVAHQTGRTVAERNQMQAMEAALLNVEESCVGLERKSRALKSDLRTGCSGLPNLQTPVKVSAATNIASLSG